MKIVLIIRNQCYGISVSVAKLYVLALLSCSETVYMTSTALFCISFVHVEHAVHSSSIVFFSRISLHIHRDNHKAGILHLKTLQNLHMIFIAWIMVLYISEEAFHNYKIILKNEVAPKGSSLYILLIEAILSVYISLSSYHTLELDILVMSNLLCL